MCGICGIISKENMAEKDIRIHRMMHSLVHRGPDDSGTFIDDSAALGFQRLSIIDLNQGHQPMANEDNSLWLVFNGEIYNFIELRRLLIHKGHKFKTKSDSEVIIHAYEEWSADCLSKLHGMFAFAIWDAKDQSLFLASDRIGIKPLYYSNLRNVFIFASEAKALFYSSYIRPSLNNTAVPYHMAFLWAPYPITAFENVHRLDPGHYLLIKSGQIQIRKYWDLAIEEDANPGSREWTDRIRANLQESVCSHMVSDVPIGAFLSGGIDSSAICNAMALAAGRIISTYFIEFSKEDLKHEILMDEKPYANKMADILQSNHQNIVISKFDVSRLLQKVVWHLDEPIGDPAAITTYLVCEAAAKTSKVLLSGVGGDEVFGGYPRYLAMKYLSYYNLLPQMVRGAINSFVRRLNIRNSSFVRDAKKFIRSAEHSGISSYFNMLCTFDTQQQDVLFTNEFKEALSEIDLFHYHMHYYKQASTLSWLNALQYIDFKTFLPCLNLAYTDKMSMANSVEVRVPFLDDSFVEKMFQIPSKYRLVGNERKSIFKKAMEGVLPKEIIYRKKTGFGAPIHSWLQSQLEDIVLHYFQEDRIRNQGIFRYDTICDLFNRSSIQTKYSSNHIWQLLTFQVWYDLFFNNNASF